VNSDVDATVKYSTTPIAVRPRNSPTTFFRLRSS
jgi:hypothetical protein